MAYDPFDPENAPANCPSCQKKPSSRKLLRPVDETTRRCEACGRTERWLQPNRKVHGDRRYERFLSRQRQRFGKLDLVLHQWIADVEA
jgi:hypothetical protein